MRQHCKICHVETQVDRSHRCRCCRMAKAATDMGLSYGYLVVQLEAQHRGSLELAPAEDVHVCPVCKKSFIPKTYNQRFDSKYCAQLSAAKAYRARQKKRGKNVKNDPGPMGR